MKKKVLYGAALALFASVSMGTLQSCKDDLSDLRHENAYEHKVFDDQLKALRTDLDNCRQNCSTEIAALKASILDLQKQITDNKADADATKALAKQLEANLKALSDKVALMYTNDQIDKKLTDLETLLKKDTDDKTAALKTVLETLINNKVTEINTLINNVKKEIQDDYNLKINNLKEEFTTQYTELAGKVTALETENKNQQAAIEAAQNEINELWKQVSSNTELINQVYNSLNDELTELKGQYEDLQQNLDQLYQEIYGTGGLQEQMLQLNQALRDDMVAADEELWLMIEQVRQEASMYWRANEASLEELRNEDEQLWQQMSQLQEMLGQVLNAHAADIENLQNQIDELNTKYDNLLGRVDNLITSIIVQGTDTPVFGDLRLPIGIQSNILFNWYGYNDNRAFQFPSASSMDNYYDAEPVLTAADLAALAPEYKNVKKGILGDVNLGKLYMTINPAGNLFNEDGFKLESSAENAYPATLKVKKSSNELTFGYSRATVEGNGFYEADVVVAEADIDGAKMEIKEGLKSTMEEALKDPSKRTAIELLKGVYRQFNGTLPAYAVRYDWTSDGKDYSVLSQYAVAATTAKPLSYSFLYGKGTDKKIPTFGRINSFLERFKEKLSNNLTFTFDNTLKVDNKEITWRRIENFREAGTGLNTHIEATVVGLTVDGKVYPDFTINCGSEPENVSQMITAGLIEKIWGSNVSDEIKTEAYAKLTVTLLEMQKQIAEVINQINGTVDKAVDDAFDQVESYAKHVDRLVNLYNKVANKINGFLSNPNHYLQVAMFYNQADSNMGILSNSLASPTVFTRGNGNVGLYASSYTGELVCPAYMKYVACTNVYDADTKKAVDGEAADVNAAAKNFNTVMTGNTIRYSVPASALKDNRIYEIVYQGVDYSGRTSTQKFYIQVK